MRWAPSVGATPIAGALKADMQKELASIILGERLGQRRSWANLVSKLLAIYCMC